MSWLFFQNASQHSNKAHWILNIECLWLYVSDCVCVCLCVCDCTFVSSIVRVLVQGRGTGLPHCLLWSVVLSLGFEPMISSDGRTKASSEPPRCKAVVRKCRRRKTLTRSVTALNMNSIAFKVAATFAQLNLTKRFTFFPSDQDLKALPEAACLLRAIVDFLQDVPRRHRRTWKKMLVRAFPELENNELDQILAKLVVRCWRLRASAKPYALHDFIEFCAGQGNLTMACLMSMLFGVALDLRYHPHHNMITRIGLRVWIDCISETNPGAMTWFGTQCSSFVGMSRRHHRRSVENSFWGDCNFHFVRVGNMMQVVTALAMMFAHFCGCSPVLEQPTTSCMPKAEPLQAVLHGIGSKKK